MYPKSSSENPLHPDQCQILRCNRRRMHFNKYCRPHTGRKKCTEPNCMKFARLSTIKCKFHGKENICSVESCPKYPKRLSKLCDHHLIKNTKPNSVNEIALSGMRFMCSEPNCSDEAKWSLYLCESHAM